jgi:hypothetical protein
MSNANSLHYCTRSIRSRVQRARQEKTTGYHTSSRASASAYSVRALNPSWVSLVETRYKQRVNTDLRLPKRPHPSRLHHNKMPPKSKSTENLKQKTLFNFMGKSAAKGAPSSSPNTPFSKHRKPAGIAASSPNVSLAGSSRPGDSSDVDVDLSSPAARALKTSSSVHNSSPNTNTTFDLSVLDSDDEAPVRMVCNVNDLRSTFLTFMKKTTKVTKRKARVHDSDSESNAEDTTSKISFSQRIAKHAATKGRSSFLFPGPS